MFIYIYENLITTRAIVGLLPPTKRHSTVHCSYVGICYMYMNAFLAYVPYIIYLTQYI